MQSAIVEPREGPFSFSEGIWLRAVKESAEGDRNEAARIFKTSGGRFYVPAAQEREKILNARFDVLRASRVARAFAQMNARAMAPAIKRHPTSGDLYLAHLFGPEVATAFIRLAAKRPGDLAAEHLPGLLETAPDALFDHGKPVTLAALYERFTRPLRGRAPPARVSLREGASGGASVSVPALKPTLVAPEPQDDDHASALALAWRGEVKGAGTDRPLQ